MNRYYVGIDTSAYTTSLGVIDQNGIVVLDLRSTLKVKQGKRGLRQQEAVFQHINNLPGLIGQMVEKIDVSKIRIVSCSSKPRGIRESYMPVFTIGKGQSYILAKVLNCEHKEFSHQEGHIGVGMLDSNLRHKDRFLSFHISGGTSELLMVANRSKKLDIDIIGGTLDLHFGQLIDRIGVETGLSFPCGFEMDRIAEHGRKLNLNIPMSISKGTWFNISGWENYFKNMIALKTYRIEDIFATLFYEIANLIYIVTINACIQYKMADILITGGVSANRIIRKYLGVLFKEKGIIAYFPKAELCTDNGVGIALMGKFKEKIF